MTHSWTIPVPIRQRNFYHFFVLFTIDFLRKRHEFCHLSFFELKEISPLKKWFVKSSRKRGKIRRSFGLRLGDMRIFQFRLWKTLFRCWKMTLAMSFKLVISVVRNSLAKCAIIIAQPYLRLFGKNWQKFVENYFCTNSYLESHWIQHWRDLEWRGQPHTWIARDENTDLTWEVEVGRS